jgi:4-methoxybenzoate monooxygenase (O-demethylating)
MTNSAQSAPVLDGDPFSIETLADPIPFDTRVREAGPMVWLASHGVWASGRHAVVDRVFRDWETFISSAGTGMTNTKREANWRKPSVILDQDPPEHTATRAIMTRLLSPRTMRRLREQFTAEADRLVDQLVAQGEFDAAEDLAEAFPLTVLPDAVGMAPEGRRHLIPYSNLNFQAMGPRNRLWEEAVEQAGDSAEYVAWQMRREALADDGLGAEIYAAADAGEITHEQAGLLVRTFLSAGVDTTVFGIGFALHSLIHNPDQWALLREKPALAKHVFEETLRHTPPSPIIGRTTRVATEVDGIRLEADQKVLLFLAAANRDPARWPDPDRFDITRKASGHMSFGAGIHACVGQLIARLEAECVLSAVARKVSRIELAGEPQIKYSNWLRGFTSLPVRVTPA